MNHTIEMLKHLKEHNGFLDEIHDSMELDTHINLSCDIQAFLMEQETKPKNKEQKKDDALESFKDWYLEQLQRDEWKLPLDKHIQLLPDEQSMIDLKDLIDHYYIIHNADTWDDVENEIDAQSGGFSEYLLSYITK